MKTNRLPGQHPRPTSLQLSHPVDVHEKPLRPGDYVRSTPAFAVETWEGRVISQEEALGLCPPSDALRVCTKRSAVPNLVFVRAKRENEESIHASAAFLWEAIAQPS